MRSSDDPPRFGVRLPGRPTRRWPTNTAGGQPTPPVANQQQSLLQALADDDAAVSGWATLMAGPVQAPLQMEVDADGERPRWSGVTFSSSPTNTYRAR